MHANPQLGEGTGGCRTVVFTERNQIVLKVNRRERDPGLGLKQASITAAILLIKSDMSLKGGVGMMACSRRWEHAAQQQGELTRGPT